MSAFVNRFELRCQSKQIKPACSAESTTSFIFREVSPPVASANQENKSSVVLISVQEYFDLIDLCINKFDNRECKN